MVDNNTRSGGRSGGIREHPKMKQLQKATYVLPGSWSPSEFLFAQLGQHSGRASRTGQQTSSWATQELSGPLKIHKDEVKVTSTLYTQLDKKPKRTVRKYDHYQNNRSTQIYFFSQSLYTTEGSSPTASRPCCVRDVWAPSSASTDAASLSTAGVSRTSSQTKTSLPLETKSRGTAEACLPVMGVGSGTTKQNVKYAQRNKTHAISTLSSNFNPRKKEDGLPIFKSTRCRDNRRNVIISRTINQGRWPGNGPRHYICQSYPLSRPHTTRGQEPTGPLC